MKRYGLLAGLVIGTLLTACVPATQPTATAIPSLRAQPVESPTTSPSSFSLQASATDGIAPFAVHLTATLNQDWTEEMFRAYCGGYHWDMGDGSVRMTMFDMDCRWPPPQPMQTTFHAFHAFSKPGTYKVTFGLGQQGRTAFVSDHVVIEIRAGDAEWEHPQSLIPPSLREAYDWPEKYRFTLGDGLFVLFSYSAPNVDWDKHATLYHVLSDSLGTVLPDRKVRIDQTRGMEEGRALIEQVLADTSFVRQVAERIEEIWSR